ncbi:MAG: site-2 protease family protein [Candidatus Staskawiczbacteria bacterium]|nr:site-2 protease family protein [Candidatus Staskawiczbacteria bacterium]
MFTATVITIFSLAVLLFSVVIHELAHGSVAYSLGDHTAKYAGRLTLNPLKHLDPFGSVILPLMLLLATAGQGPIFGWAKPVPINPYNFRDQKWGSLKVAIAGPAVNFLIAIILGQVIRFLNFPQALPFLQLLSIVVFYNFLWAIFNLVPIPPLDGSWILFNFFPPGMESVKISMQQYGIFILIFFIFFGGLNEAGFINLISLKAVDFFLLT